MIYFRCISGEVLFRQREEETGTGTCTGTGTGSPTRLFTVSAEGSGLQAEMETDISLYAIGSGGTGSRDEASIWESFRVGTGSQRGGRRPQAKHRPDNSLTTNDNVPRQCLACDPPSASLAPCSHPKTRQNRRLIADPRAPRSNHIKRYIRLHLRLQARALGGQGKQLGG